MCINLKHKKFFYAWPLALCMLVSAGALPDETNDQPTYALLLQSSPVDAGLVTPGNGVHKIGIGQTMTLTAVPRQGYRFMYWLGDVSALGSLETTVRLDSPKLVIAVFERNSFEDLKDVGIIRSDSSSGGAGGLHGNPASVGSGSGISGGSYPTASYPSSPTPPETPESDDFPVPGDEDQPIPEPATLLTLGLGTLLITRPRRKHKILTEHA